jgi:hypothetical protein
MQNFPVAEAKVWTLYFHNGTVAVMNSSHGLHKLLYVDLNFPGLFNTENNLQGLKIICRPNRSQLTALYAVLPGGGGYIDYVKECKFLPERVFKLVHGHMARKAQTPSKNELVATMRRTIKAMGKPTYSAHPSQFCTYHQQI